MAGLSKRPVFQSDQQNPIKENSPPETVWNGFLNLNDEVGILFRSLRFRAKRISLGPVFGLPRFRCWLKKPETITAKAGNLQTLMEPVSVPYREC
jgi:hypothetical protein